jgi:hypothetical protein
MDLLGLIYSSGGILNLYSYLMIFIYLYLCLYVYANVIVDITPQPITLNQRNQTSTIRTNIQVYRYLQK